MLQEKLLLPHDGIDISMTPTHEITQCTATQFTSSMTQKSGVERIEYTYHPSYHSRKVDPPMTKHRCQSWTPSHWTAPIALTPAPPHPSSHLAPHHYSHSSKKPSTEPLPSSHSLLSYSRHCQPKSSCVVPESQSPHGSPPVHPSSPSCSQLIRKREPPEIESPQRMLL